MSSCSVCGKTADFCQNGNKYHRLKNNELFCDKQKHYCSQECALEDYGIEFANIREDD